jgi:hypothetical protein
MTYILAFWLLGSPVATKVETASYEDCVSLAKRMSETTPTMWACTPKE